MVNLSSSFLYVRILTTSCMYFLDCPSVCQLYIFQYHSNKLYVLHKLSNCLQAVYMSESYQKMICIVWMVHLSASCIYVRIRTGNCMYCIDGPLVCQLSICQIPTSLDGQLVCQLSVCQNPKMKL